MPSPSIKAVNSETWNGLHIASSTPALLAISTLNMSMWRPSCMLEQAYLFSSRIRTNRNDGYMSIEIPLCFHLSDSPRTCQPIHDGHLDIHENYAERDGGRSSRCC